MRHIEDHIVEDDSTNDQISIEVVDDPGAGGANHAYRLRSILRSRGGHPDGWMDLCDINFQNGTIPENGVNGVTQEALLAIVIDRLRSFQAGAFAWERYT